MKRRILCTVLFLAAVAAVPAEAQFSLAKDDPCWNFLQNFLIPGDEFGFAGGLPNWDSVDELSMTAIATRSRILRHHRQMAAYRKALGTTEVTPSADVLEFLAEYRDCLPTLQQFLRQLSSRLTALDVPALIIERGRVAPSRWEAEAQRKALELMDEIDAIGRRVDGPRHDDWGAPKASCVREDRDENAVLPHALAMVRSSRT